MGWMSGTWKPATGSPSFDTQWLRSSQGKDKAIGFVRWCEAVVELNVETGELRTIGRLRPDVQAYPVAADIEGFRAFDVAGDRFVGLANMRDNKPRHVELHTLDMQTGHAVFHGILTDAKGSYLVESNCIAVGSDGQVYVSAWIDSAPGNPYFSHRFAWVEGGMLDTIFARLRLPAANP
jgi:hypothetical protein